MEYKMKLNKVVFKKIWHTPRQETEQEKKREGQFRNGKGNP